MKKSPNAANIAVAYLRVSTDRQELGPEAQRAQIEVWAAREGVTIVAWYSDSGVSGAAPIEARPGLCAALSALREQCAGILVCAKHDRIARDVVISGLVQRAVERAGARLVSADGTANGITPADTFMRQVIASAAEYERALIRGRTKAALAVKRARGERSGTIVYGWRLGADGVTLEKDEAEQAVLAIVRELREAGLSHRAIVTELASRGLVSRVGKPFQKTQVARMVAA